MHLSIIYTSLLMPKEMQISLILPYYKKKFWKKLIVVKLKGQLYTWNLQYRTAKESVEASGEAFIPVLPCKGLWRCTTIEYD